MKILEKILKFAMIISTAVLGIVTFLQVVMRFLFNNPVAWGQDVIRLSFVYLVFLGAAYCLKTGDHLNIDIIFSFLSKKASMYLELLINIILLLFFIFLVYFGIKFTQTGSTQLAPYIGIPMTYYYMAIPISAVYLVLYDLEIIKNNVLNIRKESKED
ncbi:TRAP-type C4-dicarboxylate transport system, small permease component [Anaerosphaera aminiphila DSM 21120]|uniref:TRAP-type C4-dicarboxylate transport system, small permease component n=1 Tax=Anaerosphaera aminiphila DSM 21120 TaxID=1120995 RepID=A0A1M5R5F4_9FIRM|nr:TRAP transporter small permease [Anaerosphaera aminiphila]SHH21209.1 TRAP-type C4-dicarboxylate transport system, small permease component [Anaerosphaera aminiphila DSM 21120]